jgi:hypothetical protein
MALRDHVALASHGAADYVEGDAPSCAPDDLAKRWPGENKSAGPSWLQGGGKMPAATSDVSSAGSFFNPNRLDFGLFWCCQSNGNSSPVGRRKWPEPERRRHLLRLWIAPQDAQPLPPVFAERFWTIQPGERGGITVPPERWIAPLEAGRP